MTAEAASPTASTSEYGSAPALGENEAAILETFVAPTYLRHFWETARNLLLVGSAARVVHLACRTGYPDLEILSSMPQTTGIGVDESVACLSIAASKAQAAGFSYLHARPEATGLPAANYSHALLLHAPGDAELRQELFLEMARLLYVGGQALVCLPTGGSFSEVLDLLAEYALKYDDLSLAQGLEVLAAQAVSVEGIATELAAAGLSDVNVAVEERKLVYDSGRAFVEDPATRYFIVPTVAAWLGVPELSKGIAYVSRAVDKYWSDERLELSLEIVALSARR